MASRALTSRELLRVKSQLDPVCSCAKRSPDASSIKVNRRNISLQLSQFLLHLRNHAAILGDGRFRQKRFEMRASAIAISGHFIDKAEIHLGLHQIGIELNGSFEIGARGGEIAPLNSDKTEAIGCSRIIRIVRKNPVEYSLGIVDTDLLKVRRGQIGLAFKIGWIDASGLLILYDRFVFLTFAKVKIRNSRMQSTVLDSPPQRRLVQFHSVVISAGI